MLSYLNPLPSLPQYCGPHKVGTAEFEIPISEIASSAHVPDDQITTIKFRLFYPTTSEARSTQPVYWLPSPQKQWNQAYASFMGSKLDWSGTLATNMLSVWNYAKIPAVKDAPLLSPTSLEGLPTAVFSHGLGGNFQTYSSIVGNLASCGVVCIAPEHRDGSAPISFIKNAEGEIERSIPYQKHSHAPSTQVLNARNTQLRTRLWELQLTYSAVKAMEEGKVFTNYAEIQSKEQSSPTLKGLLNLRPGQVSWLGHSFGAATITQFVKSVFYHQYLPQTNTRLSRTESNNEWDHTPLLKCEADSDIVQQITADTPVALLDLWTMPLRGEPTKWLWDRPMPCYSRHVSSDKDRSNMVAIMSAEFYKWTDLLNRTRAVLSQSPLQALEEFERKKKETEREAPAMRGDDTRPKNPIPELSKEHTEGPTTTEYASFSPSRSSSSSAESSRDTSPSRFNRPVKDPKSTTSNQIPFVPSSHDNESKTTTSKSLVEPYLYYIPQSAHLSQSDFGVLFPTLTKYAMKAIEPEKTLELNLRAILAVMKSAGLPVEMLVQGDEHILDVDKMDKNERWVRIPLVEA